MSNGEDMGRKVAIGVLVALTGYVAFKKIFPTPPPPPVTEGEWGVEGQVLATKELTVNVIKSTLSLEVTNSPIYSGDMLAFAFFGFEPNQLVTVSIIGDGLGTTVLADSNGFGAGAFAVSLPSGNYILEAMDSFEHYMTASFIIKPASMLTVTPSTVKSGDEITISVAGFNPNAAVTVYGFAGTRFESFFVNAVGSATYTTIDPDPAGTYNLVAEDGYGNQAFFTLTVEPGIPPPETVGFTVVGRDFPTIEGLIYTHWWLYYYDPVTSSFVSAERWIAGGEGWMTLNDHGIFRNVHPGGYLSCFLATDDLGSNISTQQFSVVFNPINMSYYTYWVRLRMVTLGA